MTRTIDALNQLLAIVYRSFPMYLADASPWTHEGDELATETLKNIVLDQQASAQRIVELILQLGGRFDLGEYPMEYTDTHFLSLDFLLKELLRYQRREMAAIERIVAALAGHHEARELAEETLGSERAHLEALEALVGQPAA
ncbi:MAG TPA: ferritin-like domain-containing protein [Pirellulales bacterium]|nr:ferritin-like domain-containing protein [Pirellulales bacterium]